MASKKDDLLIAMLRIGKENLVTGITREDMIGQLREGKIEGAFVDKDHVSGQFEHYWVRLFPDITQDKRHLSVEGSFQLLEYEELEEARASSKNALCVAIFAIVISIVLTITSIYISLSHTMDVQFTDAQPVRFEGIPKVRIEGIPTVKLEEAISASKVNQENTSSTNIEETGESRKTNK